MDKQKQILEMASKNASDLITLKKDMRTLIESKLLLADKIREVDPNFIRKLYHFPGDITSHRIQKVLEKIQ